MVIVRPDQYVAQVLPLDGHAELAAFFDGFMLQADEHGVSAEEIPMTVPTAG
jgi:hypothetical protein